MKQQVSKQAVFGAIAFVLVAVAIAAYALFGPKPAPETPKEAGLGMPAQVGGGVNTDPNLSPSGQQYGGQSTK